MDIFPPQRTVNVPERGLHEVLHDNFLADGTTACYSGVTSVTGTTSQLGTTGSPRACWASIRPT